MRHTVECFPLSYSTLLGVFKVAQNVNKGHATVGFQLSGILPKIKSTPIFTVLKKIHRAKSFEHWLIYDEFSVFALMLKDTPLLEAYLDLHPKRKAIAPEDKFSRKLLDFSKDGIFKRSMALWLYSKASFL